MNNGYFQLAILELFLFSAGLGYFWYFSKQPGDIVLKLKPETTRSYVYLSVKHEDNGSTSTDTVRAPGKLYKKSPGMYMIETIDPDIVYFSSEVYLKPTRSETLLIPVNLNASSLTIQSEPAGADIWINGIQTTKTPYKFEVLTGDTVILDLKMTGFQTYTDTLVMMESKDLGIIPLKKMFTVWISSRYADLKYNIYDSDNLVVFSSRGSRNIKLAQGRYRIAYEIGEGQYETKTFLLNYNSTVLIP
jgi:hypothetical protein